MLAKQSNLQWIYVMPKRNNKLGRIKLSKLKLKELKKTNDTNHYVIGRNNKQ